MRKNILLILCITLLMVLDIPLCQASVTVTLITDESVTAPSLNKAAENLGIVLSEINRAQQSKEVLTTKYLPMDDFALKSLIRLWAVTPFYCDDAEIVERCWVFKDGSMMVSHIPLILRMNHSASAIIRKPLWNSIRPARLQISDWHFQPR